MKSLFALLFSLLLLQSCSRAPQTKEEYLNEYSQFIEQMEKKSADFDEDDWKEQDEIQELYAREYYDRFSDELTIGEKLTVTGYGLTYNGIKQKDNLRAIGDFIENISSKGEKAMEKFLEDAGDDTEKVGDVFNRVGEIMSEKLEDIAEEVEDELQDSEDVLDRFTKKVENAVEDFVEDIEEDVKELDKKFNKD
ncbi:MAG: DUF6565 domain-containing protein [Chitinophagales bacterium]